MTHDLAKGRVPRSCLPCLPVCFTVVWFSNFSRQDDRFTGKKQSDNYKKELLSNAENMHYPGNLSSKVLGGIPGLLIFGYQAWEMAGMIYCSEDLRPHRSPRDSTHGPSNTISYSLQALLHFAVEDFLLKDNKHGRNLLMMVSKAGS